MTAHNQPKTRMEAMDDERKFLEGLLKERFNFFLVSAPIFLFGIFEAKISHPQRLCCLFFGVVIFLLLTLSILRTHLLVKNALDALENEHPPHPYKIISDQVKYLRVRANTFLVSICFVITALIIILFFTTWLGDAKENAAPGNAVSKSSNQQIGQR